MKLPRLSQIIVHDAPGEIRAAALDQHGQAWRLFAQRWGGAHEAARAGQVLAGRVRSIAVRQGGAFTELENGQEAFLPARSTDGLTEGMAIRGRVEAEARYGKLARISPAKDIAADFDAFKVWQQSFPQTVELPVKADPDRVAAVFDQALAASVTLDQGGQLHIERTRALTAIDVDTAGRDENGSAGARALSINRAAAYEAARQICLRDLGGAIVLDCVEPLNKAAGEKVRTQFLSCFAAASTRDVQALVPSRFGLMQAAIAWRTAPIADRVLTSQGVFTAETKLLDSLRQAEREAQATGAGLFKLDLSPATYAAYLERKPACDSTLKDRFGGRISVEQSDDDQDVVRRR